MAKKHTVSPELLSAATTLASNAETSDNGSVIFSPEAVTDFLDTAGVTPIYEAWQAAQAFTVAGVGLATAMVGKAKHAEGNAATTFLSEMQIGIDSLSATYIPKKEVLNPATGEKFIKEHIMTSNYVAQAPRNVGLVKASRNFFRAELAAVSADE